MPLRVIMLTVIGPLLCLAGFFAYLEVTNQNQILTRAHVATVRANEGALIGDLVHEVQKERGYSAGFIASGGQAFSRELPDQRVQTDAVLDAVTAGLKASDIPREHAVQTVVQQMSALSDMRRQVDALNTSVPQMAKTYTSAITQLMSLARYAGDDGATGRVQQLLQARTLLAGAKERAGLERAMGATGLGNGFTLQLHDSFVSLGGGQEALLLEASMLLGEANWQDDLMATPAAQAVMNARQHIMSGYESGSYDGMTAPDWFRTSTAWINLLRDKELELVAAINAMAAEIETEASGTFFNHLLIAVVSIAGVLVVAFFAFERMIRRIKGLIKVVNGFTNGDFSMTVKGTAGRGELSLMARAVDRFKQDTLRMQEEAEAAKQAETARQEQQDQVVASLRSGLARLSDGDMTVQLNADFPAGYETLREDFNQTTSKLRGTLSEILETAAHIRSGAADISQASDDLSQRTESQAATLEQTAAALDEITASVKAAAENTRSVESTTKEARSEASSSGAVVQDAVKAMAEIETSSNHIAQIVGVIDDIAFQTNLLALNAGVEAARAGEAGRGFAVVASEVRALAQRSSDSAMEIKKLISESSTQVVHGADLVRKAGDALEAIVARVEDISACVSDIAEGASEQSVGLGEINSGVVQLDQVTQQNASMVEQAAGTSTQLNRNANRLTDLVSSFRTEVGNAVPASTVDFPPQQRRYG